MGGVPTTHSDLWEALIDRFAEFKALPCLRASGPDRNRPSKQKVRDELARQLSGVWRHLPDRPIDLTPAHVDAVLKARGLKRRGKGTRPSQAAFWNGLWRANILERDDYRCRFCRRSATEGVSLPDEGRLALRLELDHLTPRSLGGEDYSLENIRTICRTCNSARSRMKDAHFIAELRSIAEAVRGAA